VYNRLFLDRLTDR